mmetsp:Transcript_69845/g.217982  ORF Transcript_69845/g.217982 Transcript_69845/m.217982 type:complete len:329 (+) Transcript_69845:774-1760(+)
MDQLLPAALGESEGLEGDVDGGYAVPPSPERRKELVPLLRVRDLPQRHPGPGVVHVRTPGLQEALALPRHFIHRRPAARWPAEEILLHPGDKVVDDDFGPFLDRHLLAGQRTPSRRDHSRCAAAEAVVGEAGGLGGNSHKDVPESLPVVHGADAHGPHRSTAALRLLADFVWDGRVPARARLRERLHAPPAALPRRPPFHVPPGLHVLKGHPLHERVHSGVVVRARWQARPSVDERLEGGHVLDGVVRHRPAGLAQGHQRQCAPQALHGRLDLLPVLTKLPLAAAEADGVPHRRQHERCTNAARGLFEPCLCGASGGGQPPVARGRNL